MPEPTNLALARIIKHLEAALVDANADRELALLAHLIDMALFKAREEHEGASQQ